MGYEKVNGSGLDVCKICRYARSGIHDGVLLLNQYKINSMFNSLFSFVLWYM
jgi:hypothetical protein